MSADRSMKWSSEALKSYKAVGEEMKAANFRALRELRDPDCNSVLTFWVGPTGTVIQQTWTDHGHVMFWRAVSGITEATSVAVSA